MKRTKLLQGILMLRFEEAYQGWQEKRLTQEDAARLLGVSDRTFRRYLVEYKEQGLQGLIDDRWSRISHRKAPVTEIMELKELYYLHSRDLRFNSINLTSRCTKQSNYFAS